MPFETLLLGIVVKVERVELNDREDIVAICRRGRERQAVAILDLSLPSPKPEGWEWIEAYRHWARGGDDAGRGVSRLTEGPAHGG